MRFSANSRHGVRKDIKLCDSIKESIVYLYGEEEKEDFHKWYHFLVHIT